MKADKSTHMRPYILQVLRLLFEKCTYIFTIFYFLHSEQTNEFNYQMMFFSIPTVIEKFHVPTLQLMDCKY